ncbi:MULTISPECIES: efflux RND transporter periplasmic adaptor subunit [unclassified Acinetobacter]|uniref:efflux RND transporter periplasmic adaptor subunit n=1 Tax=unclassified Acinetobacter TaxID=196816 RepID=UPI00190C641A|nr:MULTISPECIES: efflux RND transporter periplasmic adaptor subunit [unclassified Acinetobacter]MBK0064380.1 efflux RND transporter periplasmic adaptor subunit [Acinetobacter sp. S55]MBK0067815.1 efflux RND transporter periplasmic adaptor subunit [Acinetobacter sp. S54]
MRKVSRTTFYIPVLCLISFSFVLTACNRSTSTSETAQPHSPETIDVIQQDLVEVSTGMLERKTAFTGTIRATQQSSIQAQVSATATQVNADVGQRVKKNQVLVRLNNQDNAARLAQAQANLASAQAQAELSRNLMQRKKRLLDQGFISRVEYEQSQVDYKAQLETVNAQKANLNIAQKADQDGIIRSPLDGIITKREVEPGQTVSAGQTLFEIVNPEQLEIQAKLPLEQQSALRIGQKIQYTIQGNQTPHNAVLTRVSPVADQVSRQIEFFAKPSEAINSLSIGAFIEGFILNQDQIQGQIIPLDSVQSIDHAPYVWVVRQQKLRKINIQVLEKRFAENKAIVSGLQNNDAISRIKFDNADENKSVIFSNSDQNAFAKDK